MERTKQQKMNWFRTKQREASVVNAKQRAHTHTKYKTTRKNPYNKCILCRSNKWKCVVEHLMFVVILLDYNFWFFVGLLLAVADAFFFFFAVVCRVWTPKTMVLAHKISLFSIHLDRCNFFSFELVLFRFLLLFFRDKEEKKCYRSLHDFIVKWTRMSSVFKCISYIPFDQFTSAWLRMNIPPNMISQILKRHPMTHPIQLRCTKCFQPSHTIWIFTFINKWNSLSLLSHFSSTWNKIRIHIYII